MGIVGAGIVIHRKALAAADWSDVARALFPIIRLKRWNYYPHQAHPEGATGFTCDPMDIFFDAVPRLSRVVQGKVLGYAVVETTNYECFESYEDGRAIASFVTDGIGGPTKQVGSQGWTSIDEAMENCFGICFEDLLALWESSAKNPICSRSDAINGSTREHLLTVWNNAAGSDEANT